ncbi:unnamed protein product [Symbiodinium microadriaticum]|nr:unnamed protein product [Symbiodinium microadriaticum]
MAQMSELLTVTKESLLEQKKALLMADRWAAQKEKLEHLWVVHLVAHSACLSVDNLSVHLLVDPLAVPWVILWALRLDKQLADQLADLSACLSVPQMAVDQLAGLSVVPLDMQTALLRGRRLVHQWARQWAHRWEHRLAPQLAHWLALQWAPQSDYLMGHWSDQRLALPSDLQWALQWGVPLAGQWGRLLAHQLALTSAALMAD